MSRWSIWTTQTLLCKFSPYCPQGYGGRGDNAWPCCSSHRRGPYLHPSSYQAGLKSLGRIHPFLLLLFLLLCIIFFFFFFLGKPSLYFVMLGHMCFSCYRTYVMILSNWLILWQNALYLYLSRLRMCLTTSRTTFQDQVLKLSSLFKKSSKSVNSLKLDS